MKSSTIKKTQTRGHHHRRRIFKTATTFLFCLIFALPMYAQEARISVNLENVSVETALRHIEQQTGYHFLYNNQLVNVDRKVSLVVANAPISSVLPQLFKGENVKWEIKEKQIVLSAGKREVAQMPVGRKVSGRICDEYGETLPGATITVKESKRGTITNADGFFEITLQPEEKNLLISFIGMVTQKIEVKNKTLFNVSLQPHTEALDEVVVTGYQTISRERATGAFTVVSPNSLKTKLQPDILSRLEGQVAGLTFGRKGAFSIRGIATLRSETQPLIVVDGMPFEGDIKSINPSIIQNITILKDAAAASIYGARAANGVLVITTKEGARDGKTHIAYNGSISITSVPDIKKLNLLSSSELVDIQEYGFKFNTLYENKRRTMNPVEELLNNHKKGVITDERLQEGLNHYRALDNNSQIRDFFLRPAINHQHNLALSGGNRANSYIASINYQGDYANTNYQGKQQMGFTLQNNMKFFEWMSGSLGVAGTFDTQSGDLGMGSYTTLLRGTPSYIMLFDEKGAPLNMPRDKSNFELERLRSIGLKDESYSPVTNRTEETFNNRNEYFRVQAGLNFRLTSELNWDIKYRQERLFTKNKELFSPNSYTVRNMVNNAAEYNDQTQKLTLNVPDGGQIKEHRSEMYAYTFRTQLNFAKELDRHSVTALMGAERRLARTTGTSVYQAGYDDNTLSFSPVDLNKMGFIFGTQSLDGTFFGFPFSMNNGFTNKENRFVSFYGNASYTYNDRYSLTGSIRMDQSNLFGTDPSVQYRPLWSVGGNWHIRREAFMENAERVNLLNLRLTYGIGGNVPSGSGPYLIVEAPGYNTYTGTFGSTISSPPNPKLRWEKTATTNAGIDFSFFNNAFGGSVDLYSKYTTDLLAYNELDPTLGFDQVLYNNGTMKNKGIEITLSGDFAFGHFRWRPSLNYGYNKNKLIDVDNSRVSVTGYTGGNASIKGYPLSSVFGFRYAGLTNEGKPMYYNVKGEKQENINSIGDLVFQGTTIPIYSGAVTNTFSYKNFDLSLMFVFSGGNVFRAEAASYTSSPPARNINREILNIWKKPGDELNENASPGFSKSYIPVQQQNQWYAADKHVLNAAFIKLRDLSLAYNVEESIARRIGMKSFSIVLQMRNLATWAANKQGLDPEAMEMLGGGWGSRTMPLPFSWTIGTAITF